MADLLNGQTLLEKSREVGKIIDDVIKSMEKEMAKLGFEYDPNEALERELNDIPRNDNQPKANEDDYIKFKSNTPGVRKLIMFIASINNCAGVVTDIERKFFINRLASEPLLKRGLIEIGKRKLKYQNRVSRLEKSEIDSVLAEVAMLPLTANMGPGFIGILEEFCNYDDITVSL